MSALLIYRCRVTSVVDACQAGDPRVRFSCCCSCTRIPSAPARALPQHRQELHIAMTAQNVVFLFVLVLAAGFFALNVQRLVSYLQLGYAEGRTDHPLTRLKNVLVIGIAQKKIFRDPVAGPMHALIFWGFMVLTAGTVEIIIAGVVPRFSFALLLPDALYRVYSLSQDDFALLVISAGGFA